MPYANSQGVRIHYEVEGVGPPLVLQHGFTDSLQSWYDLGYVDALKPDYRLILVDARGHGASDKPHEAEAYKPECNVADIVSVLDELEISRAHFFGYSMGRGLRSQWHIMPEAGWKRWSSAEVILIHRQATQTRSLQC
jgi:pimeloyl-ACP methyl ester carboxylesterase